jgi:hypothetical protein
LWALLRRSLVRSVSPLLGETSFLSTLLLLLPLLLILLLDEDLRRWCDLGAIVVSQEGAFFFFLLSFTEVLVALDLDERE